MATFDVFKSDAFNLIEMTNAIADIKNCSELSTSSAFYPHAHHH